MSTTANYGWQKPEDREKFLEILIQQVLDDIDADLHAADATGAWTAYTPTLAAFSGSLTSASAVGRYRQMGKTVTVRIQITITTNGTAAGNVSATLPVAAHASYTQTLAGRETGSTGKALAGTIVAGDNKVQINFYDNTYPGANGYVLVIEGAYESA